jgi:hypothetical protein
MRWPWNRRREEIRAKEEERERKREAGLRNAQNALIRYFNGEEEFFDVGYGELFRWARRAEVADGVILRAVGEVLKDIRRPNDPH